MTPKRCQWLMPITFSTREPDRKLHGRRFSTVRRESICSIGFVYLYIDILTFGGVTYDCNYTMHFAMRYYNGGICHLRPPQTSVVSRSGEGNITPHLFYQNLPFTYVEINISTVHKFLLLFQNN